MWGSDSGVLRWGTNTVAETINVGAPYGDMLYAQFTTSSDPNWAHLASGDSSGPVFINEGAGWQLAGVNFAVDGPFNTTTTGDGFNAALFDMRGLYIWDDGTWEFVTGSDAIPSGFYSTRVSVRAFWIDGIVPPVSCDSPLLSGPQEAVLAFLILLIGLAYLRRAGFLGQPS
jgi:hypothetical protein